MSWLKKVGKGLGKVGGGVKTALASTAALEVAEILAKDSTGLPEEVVHGAKFALQLMILYRAFHINPDGTPSSVPYEPPTGKKKTKGS